MAKSESKTEVVIEYADLSGLLPVITQVAFFLALAVAMARCTMLETLRDATAVVPGASAIPAGPGASAILWLNLITLLPAILVLLRRAIDRTYYLHNSLAHLLFALLGLWAVISTAWAADKFAAVIHGSTLFSAGSLCWAATQLVRSWTRLRLVAGACLGILMICLAQAMIFKFIEHPDLLKNWNANRAHELEQRGWTEDSFQAKAFEGKLKRGEVVGFFVSSNSMAAMLVLLGIVSAAVAVQRISNKDEPGWAGAICAVLLLTAYTIYLTQSKTAYLTPLIAAGALYAVNRFHVGLMTRRKTVFLVAIAVAVLGVIAIIGHGLFHHSLPTDSMNFRWKYWVGSAGVLKDHPLLGTGWSNFGYSYLAHRLADAPEEIKDPHNLFVRIFTELGIVGGLLSLAWIVRHAWEGTALSSPPAPKATGKPGKLSQVFGQVMPVVLIALLINIVASIDFSQQSAYVMLELLERLLWAGLMILAFAVVSLYSSKDNRLDDRAAPWILWGILVALGVFLLHNLVDFSLFEAGPMMLFALLAGAVLGIRQYSVPGVRAPSRSARIGAGLAIVAWLGVVIFLAIPLQQSESAARNADEHIRQNNLRLAAAGLKDAFDNCPVPNSDYASRSARAYASVENSEGDFRMMVALAQRANPLDPEPRLLEARYYRGHGTALDNSEKIRSNYERVLKLDPNNVGIRLEFADFLTQVIERGEAAKQYKLALEMDDKLPKEESKRLTQTVREAVQKEIDKIENAKDDGFRLE